MSLLLTSNFFSLKSSNIITYVKSILRIKHLPNNIHEVLRNSQTAIIFVYHLKMNS